MGTIMVISFFFKLLTTKGYLIHLLDETKVVNETKNDRHPHIYM